MQGTQAGNDHGLNDGTDSRQKVRIPTQRVMTVLWVRQYERLLATLFPNIPAQMKEQLQLHKPQKISLCAVGPKLCIVDSTWFVQG